MWDDDFTASRVLLAIGKEIQKPTGDIVLNVWFIKLLALQKYFWNVYCIAPSRIKL